MRVTKKHGKTEWIVLDLLIMSLVFVGCGNGQVADPTESSQEESSIQSETNETGTQEQTETQGITENDKTETTTQEESQTTETGTVEPTETEVPTETEEPTETVDPTETEQPTESEHPTETPDEPVEPTYTYTDMTKTMYAKSSVNVRDLPTADGNKLGKLSEGAEVKVTGQCNETKWYRIEFDGKVAYVSNKYLTTEKPKENESSEDDNDGLPAGYSWEDRDGDGFADLPESTLINGWNVGTRDISPDFAKFVRELSEAGMYVVKTFYNEHHNGTDYYVLAPTTDDAFEYLENWLHERNLDWGNGQGGWWDTDRKVAFYMFYEVHEMD